MYTKLLYILYYEIQQHWYYKLFKRTAIMSLYESPQDIVGRSLSARIEELFQAPGFFPHAYAALEASGAKTAAATGFRCRIEHSVGSRLWKPAVLRENQGLRLTLAWFRPKTLKTGQKTHRFSRMTGLTLHFPTIVGPSILNQEVSTLVPSLETSNSFKSIFSWNHH